MIALLAAAALAAEAPLPKGSHVVETSFTAPDGSRTLEQSTIIDAPVAVLWKAYVEPREFARWDAPVEAVDLRVGGSIEASYDPKAKIGDPDNIRHRIITFLPERLLVFQTIQTPRTFPHPEAFMRTVVMVRYEPLGPQRTRISVDVTGWGDGPADRQVYSFFRAGNASLLEKMRSVYGAPTKPTKGEGQ